MPKLGHDDLSAEERARIARAGLKRVLADWRRFPLGTMGYAQANLDFVRHLEQLIDAKIVRSAEVNPNVLDEMQRELDSVPPVAATTTASQPEFNRLVREAHVSIERVDVFDLHSNNPTSQTAFDKLVKQANSDNALLIDFVMQHGPALLAELRRGS